MRQYDLRICHCGHIHMIPYDKIEDALSQDKNLLLICADCGAATLIGGDEEWDEYNPGEKCYMMYSSQFSPYKSRSITKNTFKGDGINKGIFEIYYSHGIKVPMMNGFYATSYQNGIFRDGRLIANIYEIDRSDVTAEEVQKFIKDSRKEYSTVDMKRLLRENDDETLRYLSRFYIEAFDWSGTKYANKWNK